VTSANIAVPSGWSLDPMGASLSALTGDNDNLNGGDTAKRLTFTPGTTDYAVYLSRDIQSVQVKFVNDPKTVARFIKTARLARLIPCQRLVLLALVMITPLKTLVVMS
jgi:hypothetical protein